MNTLKKTFLLPGILFVFAVPCIFSQTAVIRELTGTVEFKTAGSTVWNAAQQGQTLALETTISTGFRSTALLAVGNSLLVVRPLTRLTLAELSRTQDTERTAFTMRTGRVRAEVNPMAGTRYDFSVKSSAATASVRGTVFEFDTLFIEVLEGTVEFAGELGLPVLVDAVGGSFVSELVDRAALPRSGRTEELRPALPIASEAVRPTYQIPVTEQYLPGGEGGSAGETSSTGLSATVWF